LGNNDVGARGRRLSSALLAALAGSHKRNGSGLGWWMGCRRLQKPLRYWSGRHPSILVKGVPTNEPDWRPQRLVAVRCGGECRTAARPALGLVGKIGIGWERWILRAKWAEGWWLKRRDPPPRRVGVRPKAC